MNRLLSTMRWDIQLQFRNGFYYASLFVIIIGTGILLQFPNADLAFLLPAIIFGNLTINTFYFVSGLVLLEKREGTLEGLVVTPLRRGEYLIAKVITLLLLSVIESFIIILLLFGWRFNWLYFLFGLAFLGAMYTLVGFVAVSRYDSINEFLMPSFLITTLFSIPLLDYFGLVESWLIYLHPMQAPLSLMKAAFISVPTWEIIYGLLYGAVGSLLTYLWAQRAFYQFVILKEGVR